MPGEFTVMVGVGLTVMVWVIGVPAQVVKVGVTVIVPVIAADVVLVAVNAGALPVPLAVKPIAVFEFVHANMAPFGVLANADAAMDAPVHTVMLVGCVTDGKGFTVTVDTAVPVQLPVVAVTV